MSWRQRQLRKTWRGMDRLMRVLDKTWAPAPRVNAVDRMMKRMMGADRQEGIRLVSGYISRIHKENKACAPYR